MWFLKKFVLTICHNWIIILISYHYFWENFESSRLLRIFPLFYAYLFFYENNSDKNAILSTFGFDPSLALATTLILRIVLLNRYDPNLVCNQRIDNFGINDCNLGMVIAHSVSINLCLRIKIIQNSQTINNHWILTVICEQWYNQGRSWMIVLIFKW